MKTILAALALSFALMASSAHADTIQVENAFARVSPAGSGGAFMTIKNTANKADRLVGISTDAARRAELHITKTKDGVMSMQRVPAIDIPANGSASLAPGGYHIMLFGIDKSLKTGDTIKLHLQFENAGERTVPVEIRPMGMMQSMDKAKPGTKKK